MTFGNLREKLGTNASDTIIGKHRQIIYGLRGNDRFRTAFGTIPNSDATTVYVGGPGADSYTSSPSATTVVLDNSQSNGDRLVTKNIRWRAIFLTEIDGRHLYMSDVSRSEYVLLIDWKENQNRIENFQFVDGNRSFNFVVTRYRSRPGFNGNVTWDQAVSLGEISPPIIGIGRPYKASIDRAIELTVARANSLISTNGPDRLIGTNMRDLLGGLGGNDLIRGLFGNDRLNGGRGNDTLAGGGGRDRLIGGPGNDLLNGGNGADRLNGGGGRDTLRGAAGRDTLIGGTGRNLLVGNRGKDRLIGGANRDSLQGGLQGDILTGGAGVNTFVWQSLRESTLNNRDRLTDLAIGTDILDGPTQVAAANVNQLGAVAALNETSIQSVLTAGTFGANTAATFTVGSRTFLALNDATGGYSASDDGLIEITGFSGNLANLQIL